MKHILTSFIFLFISINASCQILTFDFAGAAGNEVSLNSNFNNPGLNSSTITRGIGLTASVNGDRFNATNWAISNITNAVSGNHYMEFTISALAAYSFSISSIQIQFQRSGTGPSQLALRSDVDGYVADLDGLKNITDNTSTQSFTFTFSENITCGNSITFRLYAYAEATTGSGGIGDFAGNDIVVNGSVNSCSSNTITTGTVTAPPFVITCSSSASGTVDFTSTGSFNAGNTYNAELSDASGSFASPIVIGSLNSTANSGTINISIPNALPSGAGYLIRIVSSDPGVIGSNSSAFSITLSGGPCSLLEPHITSLIYDGCNSLCGSDEGTSEVVFGTTGDYSVAVTSSNIDLTYTTGAPYDLMTTIVNAPTVTSSINSSSGCSGEYLDGFGTTIPPNSRIMYVSSNICLSVFDWSTLCGQGPIYMIYGQAGASGNTWHNGGNFGNNGGVKNFQLEVVATDGNTYTTNYSYTAPGSSTDGNYATFSSTPPGGAATTQGNFPNCTFSTSVLATGLVSFTGETLQRKNHLYWNTEFEHNNSHFTLHRSSNGYDFEQIAFIAGAGNSEVEISYQFVDEFPKNGINYYKLFSHDFDGSQYYKGIIALEIGGVSTAYFNGITQTIEMGKESEYVIYSVDGRLVKESYYGKSIPFCCGSGIFLIHNLKSGEAHRILINN